MAERFVFVSDKEVGKIRESRVPRNTLKHTSWSANVYKLWCKARNEAFADFVPENPEMKTIPRLEVITVTEINYWLSKFAIEVKKKDGTDYRHEVLFSLFCGVNRIIRETQPTLSLFNSSELKPFQETLDGKLKELQSTQQPYKKRADALSISDEATMWEKGVLGTHSPDTVINTLLFLSGKLFALRGGQEQRELSHDQFQFTEMEDASMLVKYAEKVSKTNQGGLKRRRKELKSIEHVEDPLDEKSFVFIYNFYIMKCPVEVDGSLFYLKPKQNWTLGDKIWFEPRPIGKNTLDKRVKEMCKKAGLEGNFSNHSLRATAVTRMFKAGLPEKQIMKRSGHQSVEGVRTYQREDPNEKRVVSNVLSSSNAVSERAETVCVDVGQDQDDEDDAVMVRALNAFEKKVVTPSVDLSGFFQGATVNNVTINVNLNK